MKKVEKSLTGTHSAAVFSSASCVMVEVYTVHLICLSLIRNSSAAGFYGCVTCQFYPLEGLITGKIGH